MGSSESKENKFIDLIVNSRNDSDGVTKIRHFFEENKNKGFNLNFRRKESGIGLIHAFCSFEIASEAPEILRHLLFESIHRDVTRRSPGSESINNSGVFDVFEAAKPEFGDPIEMLLLYDRIRDEKTNEYEKKNILPALEILLEYASLSHQEEQEGGEGAGKQTTTTSLMTTIEIEEKDTSLILSSPRSKDDVCLNSKNLGRVVAPVNYVSCAIVGRKSDKHLFEIVKLLIDKKYFSDLNLLAPIANFKTTNTIHHLAGVEGSTEIQNVAAQILQLLVDNKLIPKKMRNDFFDYQHVFDTFIDLNPDDDEIQKNEHDRLSEVLREQQMFSFTFNKMTPLMLACYTRNVGVVKILIENQIGGDLCWENHIGDCHRGTCLFWACFCGSAEFFDDTESIPTEISIRFADRQTPEEKKKVVEIVKILLNSSSKVREIINKPTLTFPIESPLTAAIKSKNVELVRLLLNTEGIETKLPDGYDQFSTIQELAVAFSMDSEIK